MTDLDPPAVMAAHQPVSRHLHRYCSDEHCVGEPWPCLPYRLAEALVAAQEDVARLSAYSTAAFDQRDAAQDALAVSEAKVARAQKVAEWLKAGGYDMSTDMLYTALTDEPEQAS